MELLVILLLIGLSVLIWMSPLYAIAVVVQIIQWIKRKRVNT